jgi:transposase InsO family protein
MGVSRGSLYYLPKQPAKDWAVKVLIEEELRRHHELYGSRRLADALKMGRQRVRRVMRLFGVKPYRRCGRKYRKSKAKRAFPNLLLEIMPSYPNHVWVADFTELIFHNRKIYISTILDLFTRRLTGAHVAVRKGAALTVQTLANALFHHPKPVIFHSDNGRDYDAKAFTDLLDSCGTAISRSRAGCPWENGYQESFYNQFKLDLGDPNRFKTLGELVAEIYGTLWHYNHTRIHSALRMPPAVFAEKLAA